MELGADSYGPIAAVVAIAGATATWAGLYLSRKTGKEANVVQKGASDAKAKLDEVESLKVVVGTLNDEVDRLKENLGDANGLVDRLNFELRKAQRNVRTLSDYYQTNAPHIPFPASRLEPMNDVN